MLVEELIARLQKLDPKLVVVRSGYEGGADSLSTVTTKKIILDVNTDWYYGKHEFVEDFPQENIAQYKQVDAVFVN